MPITVEIDEKQLKEIEKMTHGLSLANQKKVMRYAMRRAGEAAQTETIKALQNQYEMKPPKIKKDIKLKVQSTGVVLEVKGYHRVLSDFKIEPKKFNLPTPGKSSRGFPSPTVTVVKGEGGIIKGSFGTKVGAHKGVFVQGNKKPADYRFPQMTVSTPKVKKKLPINEPTGPAVAQMVNKIEEEVDISEKVLDTLKNRVTYEINEIVKKSTGGTD